MIINVKRPVKVYNLLFKTNNYLACGCKIFASSVDLKEAEISYDYSYNVRTVELYLSNNYILEEISESAYDMSMAERPAYKCTFDSAIHSTNLYDYGSDTYVRVLQSDSNYRVFNLDYYSGGGAYTPYSYEKWNHSSYESVVESEIYKFPFEISDDGDEGGTTPTPGGGEDSGGTGGGEEEGGGEVEINYPPTITNVTKNPSRWTNGSVTLTIHATDDKAVTGYSFNGGSSWQSSNTETFSSNGTISVAVKDANGATAYKNVTIDNINKTKPTINSVTLNPNEWTNENVTLSVNATDDVGIAGYSFNGGAYGTSASTTVSTNQTVTIKVKDNAGNVQETTKKVEIIDKQAPKISKIDGNPTEWTNKDVTITVTAEDISTDGNSKISGLNANAYSFDGGGWTNTPSKTYTKNGDYQVRVRDNAGNDVTQYFKITKIDKTPPTVNSVTGNPTAWQNTDATLKVNATDDGGSGVVEYSFDKGENWQAESSKTFSKNQRRMVIQAKDAAGNVGTYSEKINISYIDKNAPIIGSVQPSTRDWTTENVTLTINAVANLAPIQSLGYSFDGGDTWQRNPYKTYSENTENIIVAVRDMATNEQFYKEIVNINNIDREAPEILEIEGVSTAWTKNPVELKVNAQDLASGLAETAYSFDGGKTWQAENTKIYEHNTSNIKIWVRDILGNTIKYDEKVGVINITNIIELKSISIEKAPKKTKYNVGQRFNPEGLVVKANYTNGTSKEIKDYVITNGEELKVGQTSITIQYTEEGLTKTVSQPIIVKNRVLSSISVNVRPNKTKYIEEQDFDPTGMKIVAKYNDSSTEEITDYTIVDGENLRLGQETVTISYIEIDAPKTTIVNIVVEEKKLTGLSITTEPHTTLYLEQKNFNTTGMVVTAQYNNGKTNQVTNYEVINGENLQLGQKEVTIQYTERGITKTVNQTITVKRKELVSIEVTKEPHKMEYVEGQNFDPTDMMIRARYNNGTKREITNYEILNGNNLQLGHNKIIIRYTEDGITAQVELEITIIDRVLLDTEIQSGPNKTDYIEGQDFDTTGMVIIGIYNDGNRDVITGYDVINGDDLSVGQTSVTISYTENGVTKTLEQKITVQEKVLVDMNLGRLPNKKNYIEGENFDPTGMVIVVKHDNGITTETSDYEILDGEDLKLGQTNVTIRYTEDEIVKEIQVPIKVVQKKLLSIVIAKQANKVDYVEEQSFDTEGMVVLANYDNGKSEEITNYEIMNGDELTIGQTHIIISYTENNRTRTVSQEITVVKKTLDSIVVTTPPRNIEYFEGECFDPTGMIVEEIFTNGKSQEITEYEIYDGEDLKSGKREVIISYTEEGITRETKQPIIVYINESEDIKLEKITLTNASNKRTYTEGENFDPTGMIVTASYDDGTVKEVTDYEILDGENLKADQTSVTISYTEGMMTARTTQAIEVKTKYTEIETEEMIELEIQFVSFKQETEGEENYLTNIIPETTVKEVLDDIDTNGMVEIFDENNQLLDENEEIGTGMTIKITSGTQVEEYTTVVIGDLNGDSKMDDIDLLMIAQSALNKGNNLNGTQKRAADIHQDKCYGDDIDLLKMAKVLVGLEEL